MKQVKDRGLESQQALYMAAIKFIEAFKTPANALHSINDLMVYVHKYVCQNNLFDLWNNHFWYLTVVTGEVVKPWVENANLPKTAKGEEALTNSVADGIEEMELAIGEEAYQEMLVTTLNATIHDYEQNTISEFDMNTLDALVDLGRSLKQFNKMEEDERKALEKESA